MNFKSIVISAAFILGIYIFSNVLGAFTPIQIMEYNARDFMFELRGDRDVSHSDIVIIEMSQDADFEIPYKYPWPTYIYAKLIENLNKAGVKAIGMDVVFDQPDIFDQKNDTLFANTLEKYGNVVLASRYSRFIGYTSDGTQFDASQFVNPIGVLRNANPNPGGLVNTVTNEDDFVRDYLLYYSHHNEERYALSLEVLRLLMDEEIEIKKEPDKFHFGPLSIPTFRGNLMHINYYGGNRTFDYVSFEYIIDDQEFDTVTEMEAFEMNLFDDPDYGILHQGILEDKIVLVGATMPELQDFHSVPIRGLGGTTQMAGVEIHAHALQTIIDQEFLYSVSAYAQQIILLIISILIVLCTRYFSVVWGLVLAVTLLFGWLSFSYYSFIAHQLLFINVLPAIAVIFGYTGVTAYQFFREEKEKRLIKGMFSSYVSPELVKSLIEREEAFGLGGQEMELTAFFSDITNFSTLSEQLSASQLISFMNEYLERMTDILMENEGTLDKYTGDGIMAFFGAPVQVENHAYKACKSAIKMQESLKELREIWRERDDTLPHELLNMQVRMGINTGVMVVGNMGSSRRFNYTIMGDHVNIAARCETACIKYGTGIMVTEWTKEAANAGNEPELLFRFLDNIRVKGRVEPVRTYELIGFKDELSSEVIDAVTEFNKATDLFLNQEWDEAEKIFSKTEEMEPKIMGYDSFNESPSSLYLRRCKLLRKDPPSNGWDGVFEQTAEI